MTQILPIVEVEELLKEFVQKGGVITLYASQDEQKPIRFSWKMNGQEWSGRATSLKSVLADVLEPDHDPDDSEEWWR